MRYTHRIWIDDLSGCHRSRQSKQFAIGDAIIRAQSLWSDKAWGSRKDLWSDAEKATGIPETSLMQYAKTARQFPPKHRGGLTFGAYQALASITDDTDRFNLAKRAERDELTCEQVRRLIQQYNGEVPDAMKVELTIPVDVYSRFHRAAVLHGMSVSEVMTKTLLQKTTGRRGECQLIR